MIKYAFTFLIYMNSPSIFIDANCVIKLIFDYDHVNVGHVKEMEFLLLFIEQFSFFMGLMNVFKKKIINVL